MMLTRVSKFTLTVTFAVLVGANVASAEEVLIDGVAAIVNDEAITVSDVLRVMEPVRRQLATTYEGSELQKRLQAAFETARESLIDRHVIMQAYERQPNRIPDAALDQHVVGVIEDAFDGDRSKLMALLSEEHQTFDQWREELISHLIVTEMRRANVDRYAKVSAEDVHKAYDESRDRFATPEQVNIRMIVLEKGRSKEEAQTKRAQIDEIRTKLEAGGSFAELARSHSEGPKAESGGDWGWMEPTMLRKELADALVAMKPATISQVIETDGEFYLLRLEGRREAAITPFEDVQSRIARDLERRETNRLYKEWTARLRQYAYVQLVDVSLFE